MTEQEAVEEIKKKHCTENQNCTDSCMHGSEHCAYSMAVNALEKQIAKKVAIPPCNACVDKLCDYDCEHFGKEWIDNFRCPTCDSEKVRESEYRIRYDYCPNCGQKLDWSEV